MPDQIIQIISKTDESFQQVDSEEYNLSIQVSLDGFSFCIHNPNENKYIAIKSVTFKNTSSVNELCDIIKKYYDENSDLQIDYLHTSIIYEIQKSTLLPEVLFDENEIDLISKFNFNVDTSETLFFDKLPNLNAIILYTIPTLLKDTMDDLFPDNSFSSHAGIYAEKIIVQYKNVPVQKRNFINIRYNTLDIAITEGKNLMYFNSFKYQTKEDFIYYVIFVMEQLELNPEEVELILTGFLEKSSRLFDITYKYVRNIQFQQLPDNYNYSYIFKEIPAHYFYILLNAI